MFFLVLENLVALVVLMGVGYLYRKLDILSDDSIGAISKILLHVAQPATVFMSMQREFDSKLLIHAGILFASSLALVIIMVIIGHGVSKVMKVDNKDKAVIVFSCAFSNMAYMGYPVVTAIFGEEASFYAAVIMITFTILSATLGVFVMTDAMGGEVQKRRQNYEVFVAIFIGLIFFLFSIKVPNIVKKPLNMAGGLMTPLSMIIIGNNLAKEPIKEAFQDKRVFVITGINLVFLPLLAYLLASFVMPNPLMLGVFVMMFGMPVAALSNVYAEDLGANVVLASHIVFVTTVLSVITIPFLSFLI